MRYAVTLLFALSCIANSQTSITKLKANAGTTVQVLYVSDGTTLSTYDIDPRTLQPSLVGTIPLPKPQVNQMVTSSDGRFLYIMASDPYPATDNAIYVYDTNGSGLPGNPSQTLPAVDDLSMIVDPNDNFLYFVRMGTKATLQETLPWWILRYEVNATNGELTNLTKEATYLLPAQATNDCSLSIVGMKSDGTEIYDFDWCGTHEGENAFYDQRTVNSQSGALGSPQPIFSWSSLGFPESVQFVKNLKFAFSYPIPNEPYNELQVYPITSNSALITCTAATLEACGSDTGVAHPSAKYVFYTNPADNTTEVDAVDLSSKQIVPTGTTFSSGASSTLRFSPDGSIVYSWQGSIGTISIFGFNAATAAITTGGSVTQANTFSVLPAERR